MNYHQPETLLLQPHQWGFLAVHKRQLGEKLQPNVCKRRCFVFLNNLHIENPTIGLEIDLALHKGPEENALSSDEEGKDKNDSKSMLSGMFSMLQFKKSGVAGSGEPTSGIYLDDLNIENMELYFPNFHQNRTVYLTNFFLCWQNLSTSKPNCTRLQSSNTDHEEDGESGKGSSLPQSPAPGSSPKLSQLEGHVVKDRKRNGS